MVPMPAGGVCFHGQGGTFRHPLWDMRQGLEKPPIPLRFVPIRYTDPKLLNQYKHRFSRHSKVFSPKNISSHLPEPSEMLPQESLS